MTTKNDDFGADEINYLLSQQKLEQQREEEKENFGERRERDLFGNM